MCSVSFKSVAQAEASMDEPFKPSPSLPKNTMRILRLRKLIGDLALPAEIVDRLDFIAIRIADDILRKFIQLGLARIGNDQRRATVGGLLDSQLPDRRFLIQIRSHHEDGVALAHRRRCSCPAPHPPARSGHRRPCRNTRWLCRPPYPPATSS